MTERETKESHEDEIDLYELLLVLKKRIKLIIAVFVLGVVAATVMSFLMPNIYQARTTMLVDSSFTQAFLNNLQQYQFKGENKFSFIIPFQANQQVNNMGLAILNSLEFKKKVLNRIKAIYGNTEEIQNLERSLGNKKSLFESKVDRETQAIVVLSEHKDKKLAEDILKAAVEEFEKELDKVSQNYQKMFGQGYEKSDKNSIFILNVVEQPTSLDAPVKPKRKLIIAVSGVTFLILGVFSAFVVEWWSRIRSTQ
ncbi:YveK family protein [Thermodesulfovibrio thiophilus]|uniref:YveK family protein n=1 Tax=Thermodesulfovibrio thiophilus TaxID=340095 RepID=UPI0004254063|nr:Wzz/FepE/Etk N-terminal domain-containing protein [Thermodesulfovibrio thiophilus]